MVEIHYDYDKEVCFLRGKAIDLFVGFEMLMETFIEGAPDDHQREMIITALEHSVKMADKNTRKRSREAKNQGEDLAKDYIEGIINQKYMEE